MSNSDTKKLCQGAPHGYSQVVSTSCQFTKEIHRHAGSDTRRHPASSEDKQNVVTPPTQLRTLPEGTRDLTGDRGVLLKLTKRDDSGNKPSKDQPFVEMHYNAFVVASGCDDDGHVESSGSMRCTRIFELDFRPLAESSLIRGLEIGLREVQPGDVGTLTVAAQYAYGEDGAAEWKIPPHADLRLEIQVLDVREGVTCFDMVRKDLIRLANARRRRKFAKDRKDEENALKEEGEKFGLNAVEALQRKLANKSGGPKKGGNKTGKKKGDKGRKGGNGKKTKKK